MFGQPESEEQPRDKRHADWLKVLAMTLLTKTYNRYSQYWRSTLIYTATMWRSILM
jgi:hypothetical protein